MTVTPLGVVFFLGSVHRTLLSLLRGVPFLGENLDLLVK
jgi:hypothetical protein